MLCESWTFDRWYSEPGSFGKGSVSRAALVVDLDEAFLDVDVGRPVLAHRAELHEVAVRHAVAHREQQVEVADHVGVLRLDRVPAGDHRVGRRGLLAVVDDGLGQGLGDHAVEELAVLDVADERHDVAARNLAPRLDPLRQRADRRERVGRLLVVPAAPREVVDDEDLVTARREAHRGRPAEVSVTAQDEDPHGRRRVRRNGGQIGRRASIRAAYE